MLLAAPAAPAIPPAPSAPPAPDGEAEGFLAILAEEEADPSGDCTFAPLPPLATGLSAAVFTLRLDGVVYEISVAQAGDGPASATPQGEQAAHAVETPLEQAADLPAATPAEMDFTDLPLRSSPASTRSGASGLAARLVVFPALPETPPTPQPVLHPGVIAPPAPLPELPVSADPGDEQHPQPPAATLPAPDVHAPNAIQADGRMELTLVAADLGPLHFSMEVEGDTIRVHLTAEQPVSLDLLRRHAAELVQNLHEAGYRETRMSFGQWQQARPPVGGAPVRSPASPPFAPEAADPPPQPIRRAGRRGLDIKF